MIWKFGVVLIVLTVTFPMFYISARVSRNFFAWLQGTEPPKERFIPYIIITTIFGFILGGFIQPYYDCYLNTHSISSCFT